MDFIDQMCPSKNDHLKNSSLLKRDSLFLFLFIYFFFILANMGRVETVYAPIGTKGRRAVG